MIYDEKTGPSVFIWVNAQKLYADQVYIGSRQSDDAGVQWISGREDDQKLTWRHAALGYGAERKEDRLTADLVAWLTQILDEDEAIAGNDLTPGPWTVQYECPEGEHHHDWDEVWVAGRMRSTVGGFNERYTCGPRDAAHVVRWQPTAVLADIAAKRAIIAWCTERDRVWVGTFGADPTDPRNYVPGGLTHRTDSPVLRLLASGYAERPGYQDEWRP